MFKPDFQEFQRLASDGALVPVYSEIHADLETPLSAYWKLSHDSEFSFLLESVTGGENLARYSYLGVNPRSLFCSKGEKVVITEGNDIKEFTINFNSTPLDYLREIVFEKNYRENEKLPRFTGGAVGFVSYDIVRFFEKIGDDTVDDLECNDVFMMLCETIVAFDHAKNRILVISHATSGKESYDQACETINDIIQKLRNPTPPLPTGRFEKPAFVSNMSRDSYEQSVRKTKQYIVDGDGVQMVISQRFSSQVHSHPITIYRNLRSLNPSPYMYLLRCKDFDVIGASPEVLVTLENNIARVRPIAGTIKRGETEKEDATLMKELLANEKERAEHIMLVDLGRNDIGRIAETGSVTVNELMVIEKYSHVMHIVSDITGKVKKGNDAFDVFRACFPAGTVSGAPKVRAMQIIEELEPTKRGIYAGAVGYFGFNGDMDTAIAIRTIFLKNGTAYIQAGAGIVYDSVPEKEWEECYNKARAVMQAIEISETGSDS